MRRCTAQTIKQKIEECGEEYRERSSTIHTRCPRCGRNDKFSILKANGSCICYRGSCDFGIQWFEVWLAEIAGMTIKEARRELYGSDIKPATSHIPNLFIKPPAEISIDEIMIPLPWPLTSISAGGKEEAISLAGTEGARYLESRGVPVDIAEKLYITYFPVSRRVVFPVISEGKCYGWQARSIDSNDRLKILSSPGFKRAQMVMFADQLARTDFAIVCEGPVDAIKFHYTGGAVCTMGKEVTNKQLDFILKHKPKKIYLALDPDASDEMRAIASSCEVPVYIIEVPESCAERCRQSGKKADFGECSFREAYIAWESAKKYSTVIMEYINFVKF